MLPLSKPGMGRNLNFSFWSRSPHIFGACSRVESTWIRPRLLAQERSTRADPQAYKCSVKRKKVKVLGRFTSSYEKTAELYDATHFTSKFRQVHDA